MKKRKQKFWTRCTTTLIINQNHISSNSSLIIVLSSNTCWTNMDISDSWSVSDSWLLSSDTWSRNYINSQNLINNLKLSPSAWLSITGSHLQVFPPILISIINHNCSTSTYNLDKWLHLYESDMITSYSYDHESSALQHPYATTLLIVHAVA